MRYGKIRIEENHLLFTKRMVANSLPCEDILWAYRRQEGSGGQAHSVIIRTRRGKRYQFEMTLDEAKRCLVHLKECNPWMALGFPKGARIPLQGLPNTRDLGALKASDGRVILPHKLLRSGELYHLSHWDKKLLKEGYRLSTVVDFRTEPERLSKPDTEIEGVCYIENPILDEETVGITRGEGMMDRLLAFSGDAKSYMEKTYRALVEDPFAVGQYAKFFQYLLDQGEGAILWHCTAGKDRVGVGTALLLSALGVPKDTIMEDYLRSNSCMEQEVEYLLQLLGTRVERGSKKEENLRILMGVDEAYLESVFSAICREYESMEKFLRKKMLLTPKALEQLRSKYLL